MLQAYHLIGLDTADFFRLMDGHITEKEIVQKGQRAYQKIIGEGKLVSSAHQNLEGKSQSRQFHLDRLVGDDMYVYLSLGRRYWNTPESTNFGFIFDAEQLFLEQGAILRIKDLMQTYEDLLDEVVQNYVPEQREDQFSAEELAQLFQALDDPENTNYVSPNEAFYTLSDAIQYQNPKEVPFLQEATQEFLTRAKTVQQQNSLVGEAAVQRAQKEGETGRYEILVPQVLPLSLARKSIQKGGYL